MPLGGRPLPHVGLPCVQNDHGDLTSDRVLKWRFGLRPLLKISINDGRRSVNRRGPRFVGRVEPIGTLLNDARDLVPRGPRNGDVQCLPKSLRILVGEVFRLQPCDPRAFVASN